MRASYLQANNARVVSVVLDEWQLNSLGMDTRIRLDRNGTNYHLVRNTEPSLNWRKIRSHSAPLEPRLLITTVMD